MKQISYKTPRFPLSSQLWHNKEFLESLREDVYYTIVQTSTHVILVHITIRIYI